MKIKIIIAVIAFLLSLYITTIRLGWIMQLSAFAIIVDSLLFFAYTFISVRKFGLKIRPNQIAWIIVIGSSLLELGVIISNFKEINPLFVVEILLRYVSIFEAYRVCLAESFVKKGVIAGLNFIVVLWVALVGSDYILSSGDFGNSYGEQNETVAEKIAKKRSEPLSFQTANGDTLDLNYYNGSYLILDCWITTCGVCIKKFPYMQELYDSYKDNPNVKVAALHIRLEGKDETCKTGADIVESKGFNFRCYSVASSNNRLMRMGIERYPTVFVFSPDGDMIFKGNSLEDAVGFVSGKLGSAK